MRSNLGELVGLGCYPEAGYWRPISPHADAVALLISPYRLWCAASGFWLSKSLLLGQAAWGAPTASSRADTRLRPAD